MASTTRDIMKAKVSDEHLPSVTIPAKKLPQLRKWQVGKTYKVEAELKMTGLNDDDWDEAGLTARFKVMKINYDNDKDEEKEND